MLCGCHVEFQVDNASNCAFWNMYAQQGYGDWSSVGNVGDEMDSDRVICFWDHLTNFAIIMVRIGLT